jgi:hypothetical protein
MAAQNVKMTMLNILRRWASISLEYLMKINHPIAGAMITNGPLMSPNQCGSCLITYLIKRKAVTKYNTTATHISSTISTQSRS